MIVDDMNDNRHDKKILQSVPIPQWHTIGVVGGILTLSIVCLPTVQEMDANATIETITGRVFPKYISLTIVAYVRAVFAIIIWSSCYYSIFYSPGIQILAQYLPGTRLFRRPFHLKGISTMVPFTSWSWILLGLYFTLSSYICFQRLSDSPYVSQLLLRVTFALWEIAAPFTLLVSSIVRYVIWPQVYQTSKDTSNLKSILMGLMHNANVAFAMTDFAILGGIPIRLQDFPLAPIVGCIYIIFSWCMSMQWSDRQYGPQYIYFFLDPTLPGFTPSLTILGLLLVLTVMFLMYAGLGFMLASFKGVGIFTHIGFAVVTSSTVMRFRD